MGQSQIELLAAIVDRYDERERPLKPAEFAKTPAEVQSLRECFQDFEEKHLLTREDGEYRPTITTRELLELDIDDDDLLFLDCEPEE